VKQFGRQYRKPEKAREPSQSAESNRLQDEATAAAAKMVVDVLRPMVEENPHLLVKSFQAHHVERIAVAAITGFINHRTAAGIFEDLKPLNDPLPENWA
jgi:hypothetical protein